MLGNEPGIKVLAIIIIICSILFVEDRKGAPDRAKHRVKTGRERGPSVWYSTEGPGLPFLPLCVPRADCSS